MLQPNRGPRPLTYNKNRMLKGRTPSFYAIGNMNPMGLQFQNPIGPMGNPFTSQGMQAYGLNAPGGIHGSIMGVPGQVPPFNQTPR